MHPSPKFGSLPTNLVQALAYAASGDSGSLLTCLERGVLGFQIAPMELGDFQACFLSLNSK